jgi:hypothetical protein
MSLPNIELSIEELEASFLVFDCTGDITPGNPNGYGGAYKRSAITKSLLYIKGPDDTEYRDAIDVTGALPNTKNIAYEVVPSQVGGDETIPSGKYSFKIVHTFLMTNKTTRDVTGYHTEVLTRDIQCCIDSLGPIDPSKDAFKDPKQKVIMALHNSLEGALSAIGQGLYDSANKTIDYLKSQCKCNGC